MKVTIYHNPKCARRPFPTPLYLLHPWSRKSRATLKLLTDRGIKPVVIEYLKTPPSEAEIKKLIWILGVAPRALLRRKEAEYKQARLDNPDLSDAQIIKAMAKHPKLIERPIVVSGKKAALGRPPEDVLKILGRSSRRGPTSALQGRSNAARGPGWPGAASIPGVV